MINKDTLDNIIRQAAKYLIDEYDINSHLGIDDLDVVISGGALISIVESLYRSGKYPKKVEYSDVDIFVRRTDDVDDALAYMYITSYLEDLHEKISCKYIDNGDIPINIINGKFEFLKITNNIVNSLIDTFDINCTQVAYNMKDDTVGYSDGFIDFLENNEVYIVNHVSINYQKRFIRYLYYCDRFNANVDNNTKISYLTQIEIDNYNGYNEHLPLDKLKRVNGMIDNIYDIIVYDDQFPKIIYNPERCVKYIIRLCNKTQSNIVYDLINSYKFGKIKDITKYAPNNAQHVKQSFYFNNLLFYFNNLYIFDLLDYEIIKKTRYIKIPIDFIEKNENTLMTISKLLVLISFLSNMDRIIIPKKIRLELLFEIIEIAVYQEKIPKNDIRDMFEDGLLKNLSNDDYDMLDIYIMNTYEMYKQLKDDFSLPW